MSMTPKLALSHIATRQAQKEVTHNEALNDLDALAQCSVLSRTVNTPPPTPAEGDTYIIGTAPTGAWAGAAGKIAAAFSGWRIKTPQAGWRVWTQPESRLLVYNGSAWQGLATPLLEASTSWTPGSIGSGAGLSSAAVTVTGAAFGDFVQVAAPYDLQGLTATAFVNAANSAVIRLQNGTGAAIVLAAGTWKLRVNKA